MERDEATPNVDGVPVPKPTCYTHFVQRHKVHDLSQRRYTAPPNQAGLELHSLIGYNGNGRHNMIWHPDTGLFVYSSGSLLIVEDLSKGEQQHLLGHTEEISTLALQHDCQVLASASGSFGTTPSQICIWDVKQLNCKKVLSEHQHDIVTLAYSRDDRFLISVGDWQERTIVLWCTDALVVLSCTRTTHPVHHLAWDPYTVNEFVSVGGAGPGSDCGSVLFWLIDETNGEITLNYHEAKIPNELRQHNTLQTSSPHRSTSKPVEFTSAVYGGDSVLYITDTTGHVSAWDTRQNTCFMHWAADNTEIGSVVSRQGRLVTASNSGSVRLWSVGCVGDMKEPVDVSLGVGGGRGTDEGGRLGLSGITMEDEMIVDGAVVCAVFDDTMDMGIVGTTSGTLWYLNWTERTSTRLVSGHATKVTDMQVSPDNHYIATCSLDGSVRVWSLTQREQTLQFQVLDQACNCLAFNPLPSSPQPVNDDSEGGGIGGAGGGGVVKLVGGYGDGTVRMFDLNKVEMVLKMQPHATAVTAIGFTASGGMILSGDKEGLIAISSPTTGITVRVVNDHQGAPICAVDAASTQDMGSEFSAPILWLASSADRRVSVWSADWSKDFCELVDWLTFPAPAFTPDGQTMSSYQQDYYSRLPPSLAKFSHIEPDVIVYTGYGMQKQIQFYSIKAKKVIRELSLTHWAATLDLSATSPLIAVGIKERLVKVMDYYEGSFQDFVAHTDSVDRVRFSPDGQWLLTSSYNEICIWRVTL